MRVSLACLLLVGTMAAVSAQTQFQQFAFPGQYFFRGSYPQPSYDGDQLRVQEANPAARFFFTTVTVTLSTSTFTSTATSTFTCTTSTAALKVCTPSGRRRRGISVDSKAARGLYYDDDEENESDGLDSIFLPSPKIEEPAAAPVVEVPRTVRETAPVPFIVQPGFNAPKEVGAGRFLLAFGTSTTTITSTTTMTTSLTATCKSTTGYQLCGSTGK